MRRGARSENCIPREAFMSRVDVIVPCYKYGQFLPDCLDSILEQEGVDVRVLIIDDASPDDSAEVGARLAGQDRRVEFRRHARNLGHIRTYNEGLEWAEAVYCLLLSADDLLAPGALARAARIMDDHPEVGFVYGRHASFCDGNPFRTARGWPPEYRWKIFPGEALIEASCALGNTAIQAPTVVVRTGLQHEVGGYRPEHPHAGDTEMWLRLAARGPVAVLDGVQAFKRVHQSNMAWQYPGVRGLQEQLAAFESFFQDCQDRLPDCDRLRTLLRRGIGEAVFWHSVHAFDRGDVAGARTGLRLALDLHPGVAELPGYRNLRWKMRMGATIWGWFQPLVRGLRGGPRARTSLDADESPVLSGWFTSGAGEPSGETPLELTPAAGQGSLAG
jgi:GT2 family glycosyltransferase